jgi:hypothetical protein
MLTPFLTPIDTFIRINDWHQDYATVTTEILEISKDRICDSGRLRAAELIHTQLKAKESHIMELEREFSSAQEYAE